MNRSGWDDRKYHGRYNKYPFTEVVSFVMRTYGAVPDRSRVRILDLGCGSAHHLLFLADEGFSFFGMDGAEESIAIATQRLREHGHRTDTIRRAQFEDTGYDDDYFDCIIDRSSLVCNRYRHLPPIVAEIRRILKPGGRFFSMILNEACTMKNTARNLGDNDYTDFREGRLQGAGPLHFTNAEEAAQLFSRFKLHDVELILRKSEYPPAGNDKLVAWTLVTCEK